MNYRKKKTNFGGGSKNYSPVCKFLVNFPTLLLFFRDEPVAQGQRENTQQFKLPSSSYFYGNALTNKRLKIRGRGDESGLQ